MSSSHRPPEFTPQHRPGPCHRQNPIDGPCAPRHTAHGDSLVMTARQFVNRTYAKGMVTVVALEDQLYSGAKLQAW